MAVSRAANSSVYLGDLGEAAQISFGIVSGVAVISKRSCYRPSKLRMWVNSPHCAHTAKFARRGLG